MKLILPILSLLITTANLPAQEQSPAEPLMADQLLEKMAPHLIDAGGEKVTVKLKQKEHVLIYWSASWCGPCRKFTPQLIKYYNENGGGKDFEVVLVCIDRSEEKMMKYMSSYDMPWPAVSFDEKAATGAKSYAKGGIPRLMIINKKGEVLARGNGHRILRKFKELNKS